MKIKILSNFPHIMGYNDSGIELEILSFPEGRRTIRGILQVISESFSCDYVLLNGATRDIWMMAIIKYLLPFSRFRLILMDVLLSRPVGFKSKVIAVMKCLLLKKVNMMLLYFKDTTGYQKYYGMRKEIFRHISFKINRIDIVRDCRITDGGYIFCGGKTRRDFQTLIKAIRGTGLPLKIATMDNSRMIEDGSFLSEEDLPGNVEVIRLNGRVEPFIRLVGGARLVVLPIIPDISGVGIGVYLIAMALKKCVIISAGPGTEDLLSEDLAVVVPPCDSDALREAMIRIYTDAKKRERYEAVGYEYAMKTGGEDKLAASVAKLLVDDFKTWTGIGCNCPVRESTS